LPISFFGILRPLVPCRIVPVTSGLFLVAAILAGVYAEPKGLVDPPFSLGFVLILGAPLMLPNVWM